MMVVRNTLDSTESVKVTAFFGQVVDLWPFLPHVQHTISEGLMGSMLIGG